MPAMRLADSHLPAHIGVMLIGAHPAGDVIEKTSDAGDDMIAVVVRHRLRKHRPQDKMKLVAPAAGVDILQNAEAVADRGDEVQYLQVSGNFRFHP